VSDPVPQSGNSTIRANIVVQSCSLANHAV
jgi:hypothetical protein